MAAHIQHTPRWRSLTSSVVNRFSAVHVMRNPARTMHLVRVLVCVCVYVHTYISKFVAPVLSGRFARRRRGGRSWRPASPPPCMARRDGRLSADSGTLPPRWCLRARVSPIATRAKEGTQGGVKGCAVFRWRCYEGTLAVHDQSIVKRYTTSRSSPKCGRQRKETSCSW